MKIKKASKWASNCQKICLKENSGAPNRHQINWFLVTQIPLLVFFFFWWNKGNFSYYVLEVAEVSQLLQQSAFYQVLSFAHLAPSCSARLPFFKVVSNSTRDPTEDKLLKREKSPAPGVFKPKELQIMSREHNRCAEQQPLFPTSHIIDNVNWVTRCGDWHKRKSDDDLCCSFMLVNRWLHF